jgi:hypothetical protein
MAETASRGRITYIEGRPGADSRRAGPMPRPHWAVSAAAAESGRAVPPRQRTRCVRGDGPLAHPTAAGDPHKSGRPTAIKPSRCPSQTGPTHQAPLAECRQPGRWGRWGAPEPAPLGRRPGGAAGSPAGRAPRGPHLPNGRPAGGGTTAALQPPQHQVSVEHPRLQTVRS